ncbi:MAG: MarR family winged helix-turn-helix transcriptional regulator [Nitrospirales bacterium]
MTNTKSKRKIKSDHITPITDFQKDPFLSLLRPFVEAYLAFYRVSSRQIESLGVTPSQFDVIAELGGTEGLTCAELSKETLVTKGTLTGVLDRLEAKKILKREDVKGDRRAIKIRLTAQGEALFRDIFPTHATFLRPFFEQALTQREVKQMKVLLARIRDSFESGAS